MAQLNDIKGYWDMTNRYNFNKPNMWEGQLILHEDGWFEGIVNDPYSPYTADRFIFGAYFPDMTIELLKLTPSEVSAPFIFRGKRDAKGYDGKFSAIGLSGEQTMGVSHRITQVAEKQDDTSQLEARIESFKQNMGGDLQDLYNNTTRMRKQFVEIIKRQYQEKSFSREETDAILKVTEPIREDVEAKTVAATKKLGRN